MASTPICTIDATGIHRPDLGTCLLYFVSGYQGIYGADTNLDSSNEDGELMGFFGSALDDANAMCVAVYNAYSPATAQGTGLSSNVKINGIARKIPTNSSIPTLVVGVATTTITNGIFSDPAGNQWTLPASVTIPFAGQITVTATCVAQGAIALAAGLTSGASGGLTIQNPTRGWQSVTTTSAATLGSPVELDPQLRIRQSQSTAIPSSTMLDGIVGSLLALSGVARLRAYQNETAGPDVNGIPGFSIAIVVDGGDAQEIANTIAAQKFACGTYGTTTETVTDAVGIAHPINFFFVSEPLITWGVTITPGPNYSINTNALIQASMAAWTNALGIGNSIQLTRAISAAYLQPSISAAATALSTAAATGDSIAIAAAAAAFNSLNSAANTYEVTALTVARDAGTLTAADVTIAFNEAGSIVVDQYGNPVSPTAVVVTLNPV